MHHPFTVSSLKRTGAALVACAVLGTALRAEVIEQVLVKVNGEIFTKTDLENRQIGALRSMGQQVDPTTADLSDAVLRKMLDDLTPQLLVAIIDEMLILQRGRDLGYTMPNEQFEGILATIKKENNIGSDEQFQAALKQEGMSMADLRANLERSSIIQRVQQNEILGRIAVSDDEARRYYDAHLAEFTSPQTITLREILVSVPGDGKTVNVGLDEDARNKIGQIRQRALSGENFEKLASDLSDAPSKANAGLIGPLNVADLSNEVKKLVDPMKVGDVTPVLRAPRGYQILKLESRGTAEVTPFATAREEIGNRVFTDKRNAEFQKYLTRIRSEAIIEWKNPDLKKAYDLGLQKASELPKS